LYWLGARYYDPVAGRFISCDPYGHDADPSLYAFADGNPVNRFDPDGRLGKAAFDFGYNGGAGGQIRGVTETGIDIFNANRTPLDSTRPFIQFTPGQPPIVGPQ
jgi:uncharacterized protein RhaS with RHS repeats